jgi:hypothetical protein
VQFWGLVPGLFLVWSSAVWWPGSVTSQEQNGVRRKIPVTLSRGAVSMTIAPKNGRKSVVSY